MVCMCSSFAQCSEPPVACAQTCVGLARRSDCVDRLETTGLDTFMDESSVVVY